MSTAYTLKVSHGGSNPLTNAFLHLMNRQSTMPTVIVLDQSDYVESKRGLVSQFIFSAVTGGAPNSYLIQEAESQMYLECISSGKGFIIAGTPTKKLATVFTVTNLGDGNPITITYKNNPLSVGNSDDWAGFSFPNTLNITAAAELYSAQFLYLNHSFALQNFVGTSSVSISNMIITPPLNNNPNQLSDTLSAQITKFTLQKWSDTTAKSSVTFSDTTSTPMFFVRADDGSGDVMTPHLKGDLHHYPVFQPYLTAYAADQWQWFINVYGIATPFGTKSNAGYQPSDYIQMQATSLYLRSNYSGTQYIGTDSGVRYRFSSTTTDAFHFGFLDAANTPTSILPLQYAIQNGTAHQYFLTSCYDQGVCPDPSQQLLCADGSVATYKMDASGNIAFSCPTAMGHDLSKIFKDCCNGGQCPVPLVNQTEYYSFYSKSSGQWLKVRPPVPNPNGGGGYTDIYIYFDEEPQQFTLYQNESASGNQLINTAGIYLNVPNTQKPLLTPSSQAIKAKSVYVFSSGEFSLSYNGTTYATDLIAFGTTPASGNKVNAVLQTSSCNICPDANGKGGWYTCADVAGKTVCPTGNQCSGSLCGGLPDGTTVYAKCTANGIDKLPTFTCDLCDNLPTYKHCDGGCPKLNPGACDGDNDCGTNEFCFSNQCTPKGSGGNGGNDNGNKQQLYLRIGIGIAVLAIGAVIISIVRNLRSLPKDADE